MRSRCTRFLSTLLSGTLTKTNRGHLPSGALATQKSLPGDLTSSNEYPVTALQNLETTSGLWQSNVTLKMAEGTVPSVYGRIKIARSQAVDAYRESAGSCAVPAGEVTIA